MTTAHPLASCVMAETIDLRTRLRIAANLRWLKHENRFESTAAMAKAIGVSRGALARYLSGDRTIGFDVALKVHRRLHVPLDWLVDRDPPQEWEDPSHDPSTGGA